MPGTFFMRGERGIHIARENRRKILTVLFLNISTLKRAHLTRLSSECEAFLGVVV